ncbi:hypothetical protein J3A83DRAFT_4063980, partial [Scleroderma citrinum]
KTPKHTSVLTGQKWVDKICTDHPVQFQENIGMTQPVFYQLAYTLWTKDKLQPTHNLTVEEQLVIFLCI